MRDCLVTAERMARLRERVTEDDAGCWLWQGARDPSGYGRAGVGSRTQGTALVHRITYRYFVGPLTTGMQIDHLCRVPLCCNPAHLEQVTPKINVQRSTSAEAHRRLYAERAVCREGHPLTPENTYIGRRGNYKTRVCKTCRAAYWRARRKEQVA